MNLDEWTQSWGQLKTRGDAVSSVATELVAGAFLGDNAFKQLTVLEQADDDEQLGDIVYGALRLCCALARRSRTAVGLMEISAALHDIEETAPAHTTSAAARLLLAYQMSNDVAHFDDIDGLDPGVFWALGADDYNTVLTEAATDAYAVVVAALDLWQQMLPEISPKTIETVAAQLWR